jgi:Spherulation-specific family 4
MTVIAGEVWSNEPTTYGLVPYGTSLYGKTAIPSRLQAIAPSWVVEPFIAQSLNYESIGVSWVKPQAAAQAQRWRLLSNRYGYPVDQNDGNILIDSPDWPGTFYLDTSVIPGAYQYYGLYAQTNVVADTWVRNGVTACLAVADSDTASWLFNHLPAFFTQILNGSLTQEGTVNVTLQQFLAVLGWGLDYVQGQYDMLLNHLNDPMAIPIGDLMNLAGELGLPFDPMISVYLMRKAAANWAHVAQERGTPLGIVNQISLLTGFGVDLQVGQNIMLEQDQSNFIDPVFPEWNPFTSYKSGEIVSYAGAIYSCGTSGTVGVQPNSGAPWTQVEYAGGLVSTLVNANTGGINTWEAAYPSLTNGLQTNNDNSSLDEISGIPDPANPAALDTNGLVLVNESGGTEDMFARSVSRTTDDMDTVTSSPFPPDNEQAVNDGIPVPFTLPTQVWSPVTRYGTGAVVTYLGQPFLALRASTGATPPFSSTATNEWAPLSANARLPLMVSAETQYVPGSGVGGGGGGTPGLAQYMLAVPYVYPGPPLPAYWDAIIAAGPSPIKGLVANVDSGPGSAVESNFVAAYLASAQAGIEVYGYVSTNYAAATIASVETQIDEWYTWYGSSGGTKILYGILFDEVAATTGNATYYTTLVNYIHSKYGGKVVLNPGVIPAETYLSTPIGDIIQVEENAYANLAADAANATTNAPWLFDYSPTQIAVTVNQCPTEGDMVTAVGLSSSAFNAGWVFVTGDADYNTEASFFANELALLSSNVTGGGSSAITVTATAQGLASKNGISIQLLAIDGGTLAGTPKIAFQSGTAAHDANITPSTDYSVTWGAVVDGDAATIPWVSGSTGISNQVDTTNGLAYGTFSHATGPTGAGTPVSVGSNSSFAGGMAALEVIPTVTGTAPAVDGSSPAFAWTAGAKTITTASFTPASSVTLLVALVTADGQNAGTVGMTVSDTGGHHWTENVISSNPGELFAAVFTAPVVSGDGTVPVTPFVEWYDQWGNFIERVTARTTQTTEPWGTGTAGIPGNLALDSFLINPDDSISGRSFDNAYPDTWVAQDSDFDVTGYAGGVAYPVTAGTRACALVDGPVNGQVGVTLVTFAGTGASPANTNPYFAAGNFLPWTGYNGLLSSSTVIPSGQQFAYAGIVIPAGVGQTQVGIQQSFPATAADTYNVEMNLYIEANAATDVDHLEIQVEWFNGNSSISTSSTSIASSNNEWTLYTLDSITAPALTDQAVLTVYAYIASGAALNPADVLYFSAVTITPEVTSAQNQGLVFRWKDENDYWKVTPTELVQKSGGTFGTPTTLSTPANPGDRLVVQMNGTALTVLLNGNQVATATDSTSYTTVQCGMIVE